MASLITHRTWDAVKELHEALAEDVRAASAMPIRQVTAREATQLQWMALAVKDAADTAAASESLSEQASETWEAARALVHAVNKEGHSHDH